MTVQQTSSPFSSLLSLVGVSEKSQKEIQEKFQKAGEQFEAVVRQVKEADRPLTQENFQTLTAQVKKSGGNLQQHDEKGFLKSPAVIAEGKKKIIEKFQKEFSVSDDARSVRRESPAFAQAALSFLLKHTEFANLPPKDQLSVLQGEPIGIKARAMRELQTTRMDWLLRSAPQRLGQAVKLQAEDKKSEAVQRERAGDKKSALLSYAFSARLYGTASQVDEENRDLKVDAAAAHKMWGDKEVDPERAQKLYRKVLKATAALIQDDPEAWRAQRLRAETLAAQNSPEAAQAWAETHRSFQQRFEGALQRAQSAAATQPAAGYRLYGELETELREMQRIPAGDPEQRLGVLRAANRFYKSLAVFSRGLDLQRDETFFTDAHRSRLLSGEGETARQLRELRGELNTRLTERPPSLAMLRDVRLLYQVERELDNIPGAMATLERWERSARSLPASEVDGKGRVDQLAAVFREYGAFWNYLEGRFDLHQKESPKTLSPAEKLTLEDRMKSLAADLLKHADFAASESEKKQLQSLLAWAIENHDPSIQGYLSADGLQKYLGEHRAAVAQLERAGKIADVANRREALLAALPALAKLRDSRKLDEAILMLQSTVLPKAGDAEYLALYAQLAHQLKGSGMPQEETVRAGGKNLLKSLTDPKGKTALQQAETLLQARSFLEAIGDAKGLEENKLALNTLYLRELNPFALAVMKSPDAAQQRLVLAQMEQRIFEENLPALQDHHQRLKTGGWMNNPNRMAASLYLKMTQSLGGIEEARAAIEQAKNLPPEARLEQLAKLSGTLARAEPLTQGKDPLLNPEAYQKTKTALAKTAEALLTEARKKLEGATDLPVAKRFEALRTLGQQAAFFHSSLGGDKIPQGFSQSAAKIFSDWMGNHPAFAGASPESRLAVVEDFKNLVATAVRQGNPAVFAQFQENSLQSFAQTSLTAHQNLQRAGQAEGAEALQLRLETALSFGRIGNTAQAEAALKPVLEAARRLDHPHEKAAALLQIAATFQQVGLTARAASVFKELAGLDSAEHPPKVRELARLARGMGLLNEGKLEPAKEVFAGLPANAMAQAYLKRLQGAEAQARNVQALLATRAVFGNLVQTYREKGGADAEDFEKQVQSGLARFQAEVQSGRHPSVLAAFQTSGLQDVLVRQNRLLSRKAGFDRRELNDDTGRALAAVDRPYHLLRRYLQMADDPKVPTAALGAAGMRLARDLMKENQYGAANELVSSLAEHPEVGAEAKEILAKLPDQVRDHAVWKAIKNATIIFAESDTEALKSAAMLLVGFGAGKVLSIGAKAAWASRASQLGSRVANFAKASPLAFDAAVTGSAWGAEGLGFTAANMTLQGVFSGKWDHATAGHFFKEWGAMVVTFGILHGLNKTVGANLQAARSAARAAGAGVATRTGLGSLSYMTNIAGFLGADFVNEYVTRLKDRQNISFAERLVHAVISDAHMKAAHKGVNRLSGGRLEAWEQKAETRKLLAPSLGKLGLKANSPEVAKLGTELLNYAQKLGQERGKPVGGAELARAAERMAGETQAMLKRQGLHRGPLAEPLKVAILQRRMAGVSLENLAQWSAEVAPALEQAVQKFGLRPLSKEGQRLAAALFAQTSAERSAAGLLNPPRLAAWANSAEALTRKIEGLARLLNWGGAKTQFALLEWAVQKGFTPEGIDALSKATEAGSLKPQLKNGRVEFDAVPKQQVAAQKKFFEGRREELAAQDRQLLGEFAAGAQVAALPGKDGKTEYRLFRKDGSSDSVDRRTGELYQDYIGGKFRRQTQEVVEGVAVQPEQIVESQAAPPNSQPAERIPMAARKAGPMRIPSKMPELRLTPAPAEAAESTAAKPKAPGVAEFVPISAVEKKADKIAQAEPSPERLARYANYIMKKEGLTRAEAYARAKAWAEQVILDARAKQAGRTHIYDTNLPARPELSHLDKATVDHHGRFANPKNATEQLLDRLEATLEVVKSDSQALEAAKQDAAAMKASGGDPAVAAAIRELGLRQVTTDNLADGAWCVWIAKNQARVLKDPSLRALIREATHFEDFTAFGTRYNENAPGVRLQAALFQKYGEVLKNNGIFGMDRFTPDQAPKVMGEALEAIDRMVQDPAVREAAAKEFFGKVEEARQLVMREGILQEASVKGDPGHLTFFDLTKLGSFSLFQQWLALPRVEATPGEPHRLQVSVLPKPALERTLPDGETEKIPRFMQIVAIPEGRDLPSKKNLTSTVETVDGKPQSLLDKFNQAELAKAEDLGLIPKEGESAQPGQVPRSAFENIWAGKEAVIFPNGQRGGTLLTPREVSALLTRESFRLFQGETTTQTAQRPQGLRPPAEPEAAAGPSEASGNPVTQQRVRKRPEGKIQTEGDSGLKTFTSAETTTLQAKAEGLEKYLGEVKARESDIQARQETLKKLPPETAASEGVALKKLLEAQKQDRWYLDLEGVGRSGGENTRAAAQEVQEFLKELPGLREKITALESQGKTAETSNPLRVLYGNLQRGLSRLERWRQASSEANAVAGPMTRFHEFYAGLFVKRELAQNNMPGAPKPEFSARELKVPAFLTVDQPRFSETMESFFEAPTPQPPHQVTFEVRNAREQKALLEFLPKDIAERFSSGAKKPHVVAAEPGLLKVITAEGTAFFVRVEVIPGAVGAKAPEQPSPPAPSAATSPAPLPKHLNALVAEFKKPQWIEELGKEYQPDVKPLLELVEQVGAEKLEAVLVEAGGFSIGKTASDRLALLLSMAAPDYRSPALSAQVREFLKTSTAREIGLLLQEGGRNLDANLVAPHLEMLNAENPHPVLAKVQKLANPLLQRVLLSNLALKEYTRAQQQLEKGEAVSPERNEFLRLFGIDIQAFRGKPFPWNNADLASRAELYLEIGQRKSQFTDMLLQVAGLGKEAQVKAFVEDLWKVLGTQDVQDTHLAFTPHGWRHAFEVMEISRHIFRSSPVLQKHLSQSLGSKEKAEALLAFIGIFHDTGYGCLAPGEKKGLHAERSGDLFQQRFRDHMKNVFGVDPKTPGFHEVFEAIALHGADKPHEHDYRAASETQHPLLFVVRLADNLDLTNRRMREIQTDPTLRQALKEMYDRYGQDPEFQKLPKEEQQAKLASLREKYVQDGGWFDQRMKPADAERAKSLLKGLNESTWPHFEGCIRATGYQIEERLDPQDGKSKLVVTINIDGETSSGKVVEKGVMIDGDFYQVYRTYVAAKSLRFGGKEVEIHTRAEFRAILPGEDVEVDYMALQGRAREPRRFNTERFKAIPQEPAPAKPAASEAPELRLAAGPGSRQSSLQVPKKSSVEPGAFQAETQGAAVPAGVLGSATAKTPVSQTQESPLTVRTAVPPAEGQAGSSPLGLGDPFSLLQKPNDQVLVSRRVGSGELFLGEETGSPGLFKVIRGPWGFRIKPIEGDPAGIRGLYLNDSKDAVLPGGQNLPPGRHEIAAGDYRFTIMVPDLPKQSKPTSARFVRQTPEKR